MPGEVPLGEGVPEAECTCTMGGDTPTVGGDACKLAADVSFSARMLPEAELKRAQ